MSGRPRIRAVTPLLVVSDLQQSIDFYSRKVGFSEPSVHGDPPCFAMMNRDDFELMLSLANDPGDVRPNGASGVWDIYVTVVDVAAEGAELEALGVHLDKGPTDTFYEMREIEVLDPDGYRLCFAQDISAGPWPDTEFYEGILDVGASKLRLVLKLGTSPEGPVGCLDSPDQGASNLPIDVVAREGSSLRLEMKAIGAVYEGTVGKGGGELSGQWSQRGNTWPLVFRRA